MTTKLIFTLFIFLGIFTCSKPPKYKQQYYDLPKIDTNAYNQCLIRYKTHSYDNNILLTIKLKVVYLKSLSISSYFESTLVTDSVIINNLNTSYKEQGIQFALEETEIVRGEYFINDFMQHNKDFETKDRVTLLIYESIENANYNGVANGIPGTVAGAIITRIGTATIPHEIGHILGLKHVFEKDDTNGKNHVTGDEICDTGSYNIMDHRTHNCGYTGEADYSEEDLKVLIPNTLNYSYEEIDCRNKFTPIQNLRMRWFIEKYPTLSQALYY